MLTQEFNGKVYKLHKNERYLSRGCNRLHIDVWEYYNGKVPHGYEIHHRDFNPVNNDISNLVCLSIAEHKRLHANSITAEHRQWLRDNLNTKARPKAIEWHKSEEGLVWHMHHYESMKDKWRIEKTFICKQCNKEYTGIANGHNTFCSNKCKSKYRRDHGVDNEERVCETCGKLFIVNKYRKTKNCSRKCASASKKK